MAENAININILFMRISFDLFKITITVHKTQCMHINFICKIKYEQDYSLGGRISDRSGGKGIISE